MINKLFNRFRPIVLVFAIFGVLNLDHVTCLIAQQVESTIEFRQAIQPILAKNCYPCHGPDEATRAAGLRLDREEDAKAWAIVEGDSANSELARRVLTGDADEVMPPYDSDHRLTTQEKELLKRWIDEGATWRSHWAFEMISSPAIPANEFAEEAHQEWAFNAIDRFVLNRMRLAGLSPSPMADKATLIRRLYLDLIGLPPSPAATEAFVNDPEPKAYEKLVDSLLNSVHYGEHMAVSWLDVSRFADTNGYQNDFERTMWPWRDWVIKSFNQNLPFDKFVVHQIAGDLLEDPTPNQLIATGFNRNNRTVTEAGSIEEEWRVENCVDRVETTASAFLGLTLGCARCHDHKYDPITQKEFYQFYAFFNNVDEQGFYNEVRGNVGPQIKAPSSQQKQRLVELSDEIERLENEIKLNGWRESVKQPIEALRLFQSSKSKYAMPVPVFRNRLDKPKLNTGQGPAELSFTPLPESWIPSDQQHLVMDRNEPFTWTFWVSGESRGAVFSKMNDEESFRGIDSLILNDGRIKVHLIHQWTNNAIAVTTKAKLKPGQWHFVAVCYDGSSKAEGLEIYLDGQLAPLDVDKDCLSKTIAVDVPFKIGQRLHSAHFKGELSAIRIYENQLTASVIQRLQQDALIKRFDELVDANADSDRDWMVLGNYLGVLLPESKFGRLQKLVREKFICESQIPTTMIMKEREGYRETYLLKRGLYDQPDESQGLYPAIPEALPGLQDDHPRNRLGLARWMVDPTNPLVARVAVNRAWSHFFGRGLVDSTANFGLQGDPPTHPDLLDWLAKEFMDSNWDLKRLHKSLVMTSTYRQDSSFNAKQLEEDPSNVWLSKMHRRRLSAEQLRDQVLCVSGLLNRQVGGAPVFPYQPDGLWSELAGAASMSEYPTSEDADRYRRSLYTYRRRTVSHPMFSTFDAPSWEVCSVKRSLTNTPLQSLALMNEKTNVEAANHLALRMLKSVDSTNLDETIENAIQLGASLALSRKMSKKEVSILKTSFVDYLMYYRENPDQAKALVGDVTSSLGNESVAAMSCVAAVILNQDEFLSRN